MIKTIKYALYPTKTQKEKIKYNIQKVNELRKLYITDILNKTKISKYAKDIIVYYSAKDETLLKNVDYSALLNELMSLNDRENLNPDKKIRGYSTSISSYLCINYPDRKNKIFIPKVGYVKYVKHFQLPHGAKVLKYHVGIDTTNRYYIDVIYEDKITDPPLKPIKNVIGLDYSARHLIVDSTGEKHTISIKNHKKNMEMIDSLQSLRSKCQVGSRNYKSYTMRINKIYKKEANFRKDYLHKLSTKLANEYDCVAIEDLSMKQISSKNNLWKSTMNNSYYKFVQLLDYKLKTRGKMLIKIDRYFPSSKTCSVCKRIKPGLLLSERTWTCEKCGAVHDRDVNAAINIKEEGERIIHKTLGERCVKTRSDQDSQTTDRARNGR